MKYMQEGLGDGVYCLLIGGEVSLLDAKDHADCLILMRQHGRIPMSFSNGDFDYAYLKQVAQHGHFNKLVFAAHFDKYMYGRRGIKRPKSEAQLDPFRKQFVDMFHQLKSESLIDSFFLAHNMTITPGNVDEIPHVIASAREHGGWSLMSHQPAAFIGDDARWSQDFRSIHPDRVWAKIEQGVGRSLPYNLLQMGDVRCNRTTWGCYVGPRYQPYLEEEAPDRAFRDFYLSSGLGRIQFSNPTIPFYIPALRTLRVLLFCGNPFYNMYMVAGFAWRFVQRVGGLSFIWKHWRHIQPTTYVMHNFMDSEVVKVAHELNERGEWSNNDKVKETQERLKACSYSFAHPDTGKLVPGCVQHGVLDPNINKELKKLLPCCDPSSKEQLDW